MTENDIDLKAYAFVPKIIEIKELNSTKTSNEALKGSIAEREITDLSDILDNIPAIVMQYFSDLSDRKIYVIIKGIKYGFYESDYKEFYKFIYKIHELKNLSDIVSIEYITEKVLLWIVDIYIHQFSTENLNTYLSNIIDNDINKYTFYYPILNIDIEEEFLIGDAQITYFTKEYFNQLFEKKNSANITDKEFNELYRKYEGRVFVAVEVKAERKLASKIAYEKACYAIDILKLTSSTVSIPFEKCFLELESKIPLKYEYISFKNDNQFDISFHTKVNKNHQAIYKSEMIKGIMPLFNQFGKLFKSTLDLENILKHSIIFCSKCISEDDLHLRISKLIMILESIFLKDNETNRMVIKCKTRFLSFNSSSNFEYNNKLKLVLDNMYEIRHNMTHKSIRVYIDNNELRTFQIELIDTLFRLSKKSRFYKTKDKLIDYLDEKLNT